MAENKTRESDDLSVTDYLASISDEARRRDCETLAAAMARVTDCPARMWGPSIVGFDRYHYVYESGREGDMCVVGFSSRKSDISLYGLFATPDSPDLLARLGKHRLGKSCLYIRRLDDVDLGALEELIARSTAATREKYAV